MLTGIKKAFVFVVLLCLIIASAAPVYADSKDDKDTGKTLNIEKKYETVELSQEASKTKVISGDLLYDGGDWTLAISDREPSRAQLLYENAICYKGNTYDVLMDINASSDDYAEMVVSGNELKYSVNSDEVTKSEGDKIGDLAEEYATHEPRYNYVLGGRDLSSESGKGLDCAHFVGRVYEDCGQPEITASGADANVNHLHDDLADKTVNDIIKDGPASFAQMKRGDILIFYKNGGPSHTAIYLGNDKIAHAMDEDNGVCVIDLKYNEETGIAGYSGKTVQRVIRPARTSTVVTDANVKIEVAYTIVDKNRNPIGGLDIGAIVKDGKKTVKAYKITAPKNDNGYYAEQSTIHEKTVIASKNKKEVITKMEAYIPVIVDYEEWSFNKFRKGNILFRHGGKMVK